MNSADSPARMVSYDALRDLLHRVFVRHGVSPHNAAILAANCAGCERDGSLSHGIFRIPGYLASLSSGWVDGGATASFEEVTTSFIKVDAANGFAQPALAAVIPHSLELVAKTGVCVLAIRDSHHFSALWPDLEIFADHGHVALSMVTGLACVAPPTGRRPVFGTNPIAFATPVAGRPPLIFDFATSAMSNGDLRLAARAGNKVHPETGIDRLGCKSDDPNSILDGGALLPFGGHKGGALSMMVEILASALTGGQFSSEVNFSGYPGAETPRTGQLIIAIDPQKGDGKLFASRVASLIDSVRAAGQTRLPSDRRLQMREQAARRGIPISEPSFAQLIALAG